jgi:hypothetical protein
MMRSTENEKYIYYIPLAITFIRATEPNIWLTFGTKFGVFKENTRLSRNLRSKNSLQMYINKQNNMDVVYAIL